MHDFLNDNDFGNRDSFDKDRKQILQFLIFVRDFLSSTQRTGKDNQGEFLFAKELFLLMQEAWKIVAPYFVYTIGSIQNISDSILINHGLVGPQLQFKLATVHWIKKKYEKKGGKSLIRRLIDTIDTLLLSILDAFGVGSAISEFKDSVKNSIDD